MVFRSRAWHTQRLIFNRDPAIMKARKFIYEFEEGDGKDKMLLGGKGANLCEMTQIGLNVPPGFTVTTEACLAYLERNQLPMASWTTSRRT